MRVSGKRVAQIEIDVVRGGQRPVTSYRIILKNALITSINVAAGTNNAPEETFTVAYEEISWSFSPQLPNGQTVDELKWGWNIAKGARQ